MAHVDGHHTADTTDMRIRPFCADKRYTWQKADVYSYSNLIQSNADVSLRSAPRSLRSAASLPLDSRPTHISPATAVKFGVIHRENMGTGKVSDKIGYGDVYWTIRVVLPQCYRRKEKKK